MENICISDFSQKAFVSPDKCNSVLYTWAWNVPMDKKNIDAHLQAFEQAGITGFYILPLPKAFRPDTMKTSMIPEYLSEDFFELVKYTLRKAAESGMEAWIYDEGGWPSGGACGNTLARNPDALEMLLYKREVLLKKGETYTASEDAIAAFYEKKRIDEGFTAETDVGINEYCAGKCTFLHPNRVDSTDRGVIDTFIDNTYEAYKKGLGEVFDDVRAVFTDEPSVIGNLIPRDLFRLFTEKYGYDLKDYIYCVENISLARTREEQQARVDYGRLVGELFYANYCKNLGDWCRKNGKQFAGHLDLDHIPNGAARQGYFSHLHGLSAFDIPGVDVIWHQIRMPEGDIPPVPEGAPFFPRLASSAAHQSGGNLALTESFAVYGDGITPDEFRYVLNYQAVRGINVFNVMLSASGNSVSSLLVERPVYTPLKPGFFHLEHLNTYFRRLSYLLKLGEPMIDTALYIPCGDFWANEEVSKAAYDSYISAGMNLENCGTEFDIIDDYAIMEAIETDEGLRIGNITYKNIVVPGCAFMPDDVREKVKKYIKSDELALKTSEIRMMKRKLPSGEMYFMFNEGMEKAETAIDIPLENLYRLNAAAGEITVLKDGKILIESGDIAVLYHTEQEPDAVSDEIEYRMELHGFEIAEVRQCRISEDGISMEHVPEDTEITGSFSGEITYRTRYELPDTPMKGERYKIVLTDTALSAGIAIDGKPVATVGMTPMEAVLDGAMLSKEGIISITVANTSANEIFAKNDLIMSLPKEIVGPYHKSSLPFEQDGQCIRFGKTEIIKCR